MKNTEIFSDYDMVVSMSERIINSELTHLTKLGVIRPQLIVVQEIVKRNYVYTVLDDESKIPVDDQGNPTCACINAQILPQIVIAESGTNVTFLLKLRGGTACFWEGNGPLATLQTFDMTGWSYGITITLDLKGVEKQDLGNKVKVPELVKDQLYHFMDSMFTVNHLFMDFESTDLLRFDPAHTDTKDAGDLGTKQLVEFMQFYLKDLVKSGNPFILGYSLTATSSTQYPAAANVPDSLKPVGTTYTLYHETDPAKAGLSNLNFVLATAGGHGTIAGTPGNFDSNWLSSEDQCDAKMIYANACLLEKLILKPFYESFRSTMYSGTGGTGGIKGQIDVPEGNDYATAKALTDKGLTYTISNVNQGHDQYVNSYTVAFVNDTKACTTTLAFSGTVSLYKEKTTNVGVSTADAWASIKIPWTGSVALATVKNDKGQPTLSITKSFSLGTPQQDSHENDTAKAFNWIGTIVGTILDAFSGFLDHGFFTKLLDGLMGTQIPGLGDVSVAFGNLGAAVDTVVMLPAGQVFYFKNPMADAEGNLSMLLTYKSQNDLSSNIPAAGAAAV